MVQKFRDLTERVGFLHDAETRVQIGAGRLDLSPSAITFEMPVDDDVEKKLGLSRLMVVDEDLADRFVFRDRHGKVGLGRCRLRSSTRNMGGGLPGWVRLEAQYAVEIGSIDQDYWSVNGLRSEIAGLAAWTGLSSVTTQTTGDERGLIKRIEQAAESGDGIQIGGSCGLSLYPFFSNNESRANGRYTITEKVFVQTRTDEAIPWEDHIGAHQSIQDLMTIAYWKDCGIRTESVSNNRYPLANPRSGERLADKWRDAAATWGGRGDRETPMELPHNSSALFSMHDLGTENVRRWVDEADDWVRIVGPLASSPYLDRLPVEVRFMQIAVAIEALGYRIGREQGLISDKKASRSFPEYLRLIKDSLDCSIETVLAGSPSNEIEPFPDYATWAKAFNQTYFLGSLTKSTIGGDRASSGFSRLPIRAPSRIDWSQSMCTDDSGRAPRIGTRVPDYSNCQRPLHERAEGTVTEVGIATDLRQEFSLCTFDERHHSDRERRTVPGGRLRRSTERTVALRQPH